MRRLGSLVAALLVAHALARRLASDLRAGTRGAVRVADALDALLAARRAGYDEMETACLRGLVAARADSAATDGDDVFLVRRMVSFSVRGFRLLLPSN